MKDVIYSIYQREYYTFGIAFFGSYKAMRYRIGRDPLINLHENPKELDNPNAIFIVETWEDRKGCYEKCPSSSKEKMTFPFNDPDSINKILEWLNYQYHTKYENVKWGEWDG